MIVQSKSSTSRRISQSLDVADGLLRFARVADRHQRLDLEAVPPAISTPRSLSSSVARLLMLSRIRGRRLEAAEQPAEAGPIHRLRPARR